MLGNHFVDISERKQ